MVAAAGGDADSVDTTIGRKSDNQAYFTFDPLRNGLSRIIKMFGKFALGILDFAPGEKPVDCFWLGRRGFCDLRRLIGIQGVFKQRLGINDFRLGRQAQGSL